MSTSIRPTWKFLVNDYIPGLVRELMAPDPLPQTGVTALILAAFVLATTVMGTTNTIYGRVLFASFFTVMAVSVISSLQYHVKVQLRWMRIRRASRSRG